jgi:hypothetical protein
MTKSTWMRWGVCTLAVIAMIALLGGCSKKESAQTEETATEEMATETTTAPAAAGTYSAPMANGTASLMLNADMTASLSMQPMENAPAVVENGTWTSMGSTVDVTFSKTVNDSTMSTTLNFSASGDSLSLTNGDAVGIPGLVLMKQH